MLHGRSAEQALVDELLSTARTGRSGVLVVRGEAGIGKSALLTYAATRATSPPPSAPALSSPPLASPPWSSPDLGLSTSASPDRASRTPELSDPFGTMKAGDPLAGTSAKRSPGAPGNNPSATDTGGSGTGGAIGTRGSGTGGSAGTGASTTSAFGAGGGRGGSRAGGGRGDSGGGGADLAVRFRILRGTAVESESVMPFAGLNLLLGTVVDRVDALSPNQASALRAALGLAPPDGGDHHLVGLAVLTLLADLAEQSPVLCLVDDAHWLDPASAHALVFAARRLQAEGIAMIFAARDLHAPPFPAPGLPELRLTGLAPEHAAALLEEHAADLPRYVRDQIAHEARGNPLALLELPAAQREGHLPAAHAYRVAALPTHSRIQQTFADRIGTLPERTRTLLLVAAADDTGDPGVVFHAAGLLGASVDDLEVAEQRQLLRSDDGRLTFRHPLIRAAAYQSAPLKDRLAVHRALAEALAEVLDDAHRSAWHLAAATTAPDEDVARALARTADDARSRGGYLAVASAYHRAAELTPDPVERGHRLAAAAGAAGAAGQFDRAVVLADQAWELVGNPVDGARVARIQARLASEQGRSTQAAAQLARAVSCAEHTDRDLAGELLFNAANNAWAGRDFEVLRAIAARAEGLPGADDTRTLAKAALGLEGDDVPGGITALRALLDSPYVGGPGNAVTAWWHLVLGDDQAAYTWAFDLERQSRAQGALGVLPRALAYLARGRLHLGRHRDARATAEEGLRIAADIGQEFSVGFLSSVLAELAAIEGDEDRLDELVATMTGDTPQSVRAACASALLDLGLGRHEAVLDRLADVAAGAHRLYSLASLPDLVEAAARLGRHSFAEDAATWYDEWASATGRPWARAVAARCRALLTDDERWYAEAVELHRVHEGRPFERARTELLYGEWLRRARRKADARTHLRSALEKFERLGATPWAARARTELRATGESRAVPGPDPLSALTPQELQVVRLAAEGLSNRDIGAQLFLSPRTVGYHLYKAYPKLGVSSRVELGRLALA
ncbi:regulatory LuxR family protein [Saccharothrix carnea]|uniref:Regulatory LuxR family protein n=1 Tax=Saccharothrix carnea TaxID=1280637 RepID=A0A2P8IEN4_SACCR|nr:LuxR C-terminal-related transcriptional regulator [Saccharothrix carnea]PSL56917.1 regulatory LuxR family protein [Saccharothrix carnea]